jgi:hypothetical protein
VSPPVGGTTHERSRVAGVDAVSGNAPEALSVGGYRQGRAHASPGVAIAFTQHAADGIHTAIVRAGKPPA